MEPRPSLALPFSKPRPAGAGRRWYSQFSRCEAGIVIRPLDSHLSFRMGLVWAVSGSKHGREFAACMMLDRGGPNAWISIRIEGRIAVADI
jgi:hypothetical protein